MSYEFPIVPINGGSLAVPSVASNPWTTFEDGTGAVTTLVDAPGGRGLLYSVLGLGGQYRLSDMLKAGVNTQIYVSTLSPDNNFLGGGLVMGRADGRRVNSALVPNGTGLALRALNWSDLQNPLAALQAPTVIPNAPGVWLKSEVNAARIQFFWSLTGGANAVEWNMYFDLDEPTAFGTPGAATLSGVGIVSNTIRTSILIGNAA